MIYRYFYLLLFIFSLLLSSFVPKHALHLSITEADFKSSQSDENVNKVEMQISHKIFIDDLERVLRKKYAAIFIDSKPNIATSIQHKEAQKYAYRYLKTIFEVKVDNQAKNINYFGWEFEENVVWIYGIAILEESQSYDLQIKNMILLDLFDDQRNMLYLSKGDIPNKKKKFLSFTTNNRIEKLDF